MAQEIEIIIQNYQGAFILDLLNEFRKDVIRSVFRDIVIPKDSLTASDDEFRTYSESLKTFLTEDSSKWKDAYSAWSRNGVPADIDKLFDNLSSHIHTFLKACASCDKKSVWAYLYAEEFSGHLRISPSANKSIAGLFNLVALTISDEKRIRLIQPPDIILNEEFHTLKVCFPLLNRTELEALEKKFLEGAYIYNELKADFDDGPPLFRGNTAAFYDTRKYEQCLNCESVLEKSLEVHNTGFLQIRPKADEQGENPFGFFQLQCTLPGLIERLFPSSLSRGRKALAAGETTATIHKPAEAPDGVFMIEFDDRWWEEEVKNKPYFLLRLRELAAGWPRRLFNFLQLSKRTAAELDAIIRSRTADYEELERLRQKQIDEDVKELVNQLSVVSAVAHRVQMKVRPASAGIFSLYTQVVLLFKSRASSYVYATFVEGTSEVGVAFSDKDTWLTDASKVTTVNVLAQPRTEAQPTCEVKGSHETPSEDEWKAIQKGLFLIACAARNPLMAWLAAGRREMFSVLKLLLHRVYACEADSEGNEIGYGAQILGAVMDAHLNSTATNTFEIIVGSNTLYPTGGNGKPVVWLTDALNMFPSEDCKFVVRRRSLAEMLVKLQQLLIEELVPGKDRQGKERVHVKKVNLAFDGDTIITLELSDDLPTEKLHWARPGAEEHGLTGCLLVLHQATGSDLPVQGNIGALRIADNIIKITLPKPS